ncbi:MAG: NAD+ synthase [Rikenellaceae bacterium]
MKIALAQLNYTVGDIELNSSKIIDSIQRAKCEGADLVLFAEQAISGLPGYDLLRSAPFVEQCEEALKTIASHSHGIYVLVGLPLLTPNGTISAAALLHNGEIIRYIGKQHITARREMGFVTPSDGCEYVTIKRKKCAIVVGEDAHFTKEFDASAKYIISINARKYSRGALTKRYEASRGVAYRTSKSYIMINQVGGSSEIVYDGTSGVFLPNGKLALLLKSFEEDFTIYDTDAKHEEATSQPPFTSYNHRTMMLYKGATLGLKDFFFKNGYKKACIGLSGGIDSAVVASIAVATLGRENVMALMMPSKFSTTTSVEHAVALAENLGIEYKVVPISDSYETMLTSLNTILEGSDFDATEENIQARIRTIMLMAVQNKLGYVVLNSSNKSENALGLCTLYGDTAGAFSVTGDLYKSEMYDLARYINKISDNVIPESILAKEPSSELAPEQKDSDILPPYEVVDAILRRIVEKGQSCDEIINAGFDSVVVNMIHDMLLQSEKKRYQYPPTLRLSECSFRHERLMPLTNKYSG